MNITETLDQKRSEVVYLNDAMRAIIEDNDDLTDDHKQAFADGEFLRNALIAEGIELEARRQALLDIEDNVRTAPQTVTSGDGATGAPAFHRDVNPYDEDFIRTAGIDEAVERSVGECEYLRRDESGKVGVTEKLALSHTDPDNMRGFGEYWLLHSSPEYTRAFFHMVNGQPWRMTGEEQAALLRAREWDVQRGITLTAANGGALIPAHLDPTVILSTAGVVNPLRQISKVVPVMTNTWTGVTTTGITLAYRTEGGDSADVAATYASPSITMYRYDGTIPVTLEAEGDIAGLASEVVREVAEARDRLEGSSFAVGSGSNAPIGVVTALSTEATRRSQHATNNAFTATDLINTQNALVGGRQAGAAWLGSLPWHNRVRALGDTSYYTRSATLDQGASGQILGKPAYESSDMTTGLNTATNYAFVYGNFQGFQICDRVGLEVEFVPHLFSTGNGLPNGKRGWYVWGRHGSDVIDNTSFILSTNPGITG